MVQKFSRWSTLFALIGVLGLASIAFAATCPTSGTCPAAGTTESCTTSAGIIDLQTRIAALQTCGISATDYNMAKAIAWLDFACDAKTKGAPATVIYEATHEAEVLVSAMEAGGIKGVTATPIIDSSRVVRSDLWARADAMKSSPNFPCAAATVAQLEVTLVQAGYEKRRKGTWSQAQPYICEAEKLAAAAECQIAAGCTLQSPTCPPPTMSTVVFPPIPPTACPPTVAATPACADICPPVAEAAPVCPPVVVTPVCPPVAEVMPTPAPEPVICPPVAAPMPVVEVPSRIFFAFDRSDLIAPSKEALQPVITAMLNNETMTVRLIGNADARGTSQYNMRLGMERANAVQAYLIANGIASNRITVSSVGESRPLMVGSNEREFMFNRRVDLNYTAPGVTVKIVDQTDDLQPPTCLPTAE